jgi:hypothetical protein
MAIGVLTSSVQRHEADRAAGAGDRAVHGERLGALLRLGEGGGHEGENSRREQRREDALDGTS